MLPGILALFPCQVNSQTTTESLRLKTVVIDPGHGGNDPGAISGDVREKNIVLDVGLLLGKKIVEQFPGIKVVYTRNRDVFIPLYARATIANRNQADLFISLHANCVTESSVKGTETFTLGLYRSQENLEVAKKENSVILLEDDYSTNYAGFNPNETESYIMFENMQSEYQAQSIDFASGIQEAFAKTVRLRNRGVKQAGFLVLRQTTMPGVLVEMGFISNPEERAFLTSAAGKEKIAQAVFNAFSNYKKTIDSKSWFAAAPDKIDQQAVTMTGNDSQNTDKEENKTDSVTDIKGERKNQENQELLSVKPRPQKSENNKKAPPAETSTDESRTREGASAGIKGTPEEKSVAASPKGSGTKKESIPAKAWYSVQISATSKLLEPSDPIFKGEKGIIRLKAAPLYKYYSGKYTSAQPAVTERSRLLKKFPDAFVVMVENGISRPLKNSDIR